MGTSFSLPKPARGYFKFVTKSNGGGRNVSAIAQATSVSQARSIPRRRLRSSANANGVSLASLLTRERVKRERQTRLQAARVRSRPAEVASDRSNPRGWNDSRLSLAATRRERLEGACLPTPRRRWRSRAGADAIPALHALVRPRIEVGADQIPSVAFVRFETANGGDLIAFLSEVSC
jgi:hypothetical protein